MTKASLFLISSTLSLGIAIAQQIDYYNLIVEDDTFSLSVAPEEMQEAEVERKLRLKFISDYRTKAIGLSEDITADLKLLGDSTIYSAIVFDYFDEYMISFLGVSEQLSKRDYAYEPMGFQRVRYEDLEWITTSGKKRFNPQFIIGITTMAAGSTLTVFSIADLFVEKRNTFPIWLIPVGLAVTYVGYRLIEAVMTKTFLLENWTVEVIPD